MSVIMKGRVYAILAVAVILLITACIWSLREQHGVMSGVSLAFVSNGTNQFPRQATFRLYNDGPRAIFLSWMIVEAKTPTGWRTVDKIEPKDPRGVHAGKSMDLLVAVPAEAGRWRLRAVYGNENRGPVLMMTRVELAIRSRSVSGWHSVGVFTGSNSAVSEVSQ